MRAGLTNILFSLVVLDCVFECSTTTASSSLPRREGAWQLLLRQACTRRDLKLEAMTMLKVSAMAVFGVYDPKLTSGDAFCASPIARPESCGRRLHAFNRLYDSHGNFLVGSVEELYRLEELPPFVKGQTVAQKTILVNGKETVASAVVPPPSIFVPFASLDVGHKFLVRTERPRRNSALLTEQRACGEGRKWRRGLLRSGIAADEQNFDLLSGAAFR